MHANTLNALRKAATENGFSVASAGAGYVNIVFASGVCAELFSSPRGWHFATAASVADAGSLAAALATAKAFKTPSAAAASI